VHMPDDLLLLREGQQLTFETTDREAEKVEALINVNNTGLRTLPGTSCETDGVVVCCRA
jgi:hypothetical protein